MLTVGVVINIMLNYFLIPILGIEGAAVGTLAGYIVPNSVPQIFRGGTAGTVSYS